MRHYVTLAATLALAAPVCAATSKNAPISLGRTGQWNVNYDDDSCQIASQFGSGDQAIIARLTRFQPGDPFDLALIGEPVHLRRGEAKVKLSFGLASEPTEREAMTGTSNGKPMILIISHRFDTSPGSIISVPTKSIPIPTGSNPYVPPPAITLQQEAQVKSLAVELASRSYRLELGSMAGPMAAMRTCMDDLLRHWGYDPTLASTLSRTPSPIGNPGNWVTFKDYPSRALTNGSNGIVQFRVDLDESGKVSRCSVLYRTSPDEFGDLTCRLIASRARFQPALDAAGKPVKWFYISRVRWMTGF